MTSTKVNRRSRTTPKIVVAEPLLTILLAKDNGLYCAKCPELDLVTELPTVDAALEDLIEAIQDYAKEYLRDRDRYAASPNRAHHLTYIEAIAACKTDWELRTLIEIKHGLVHV
jgi:antitoxin of RelE/RelB toxin-antitoxin system